MSTEMKKVMMRARRLEQQASFIALTLVGAMKEAGQTSGERN
jgi:hypothetical protein